MKSIRIASYKKLFMVMTAFILAVPAYTYAQSDLTPDKQVQPTPGAVWDASQQWLAYQHHERVLGALGGSISNVGGAQMAVAAANEDTNTTQQMTALLGHLHRMVGGQHAITPGAGAVAENIIKSNQANEEAFAAADDLANAITYAMLKEFHGKTNEQIMAEVIQEGIDYGYINPDPALLAALGNETPSSFSIISKAFAYTNQNDPMHGVPTCGRGHPCSLKGITGSKYGVSMPAGKLPQAQNHGRGHLYNNKIQLAAKITGTRSIGTTNASAQGIQYVFASLVGEAEGGAATGKNNHELVFNSTINGGGSTAQSDNSDHSYFFISSAYANAEDGPNQQVDSAASNLDQKLTGATNAGKKACRHTGLQQASALQLQHGPDTADANNVGCTMMAGGSGLENREQALVRLNGGSRHNGDQWTW